MRGLRVDGTRGTQTLTESAGWRGRIALEMVVCLARGSVRRLCGEAQTQHWRPARSALCRPGPPYSGAYVHEVLQETVHGRTALQRSSHLHLSELVHEVVDLPLLLCHPLRNLRLLLEGGAANHSAAAATVPAAAPTLVPAPAAAPAGRVVADHRPVVHFLRLVEGVLGLGERGGHFVHLPSQLRSLLHRRLLFPGPLRVGIFQLRHLFGRRPHGGLRHFCARLLRRHLRRGGWKQPRLSQRPLLHCACIVFGQAHILLPATGERKKPAQTVLFVPWRAWFRSAWIISSSSCADCCCAACAS